ncbi:MAG: GAF domain-containing protein [Pleurocapsa sp.]
MDSASTYQEQNSLSVATEVDSSKLDLVQKIKKSLYKQERDRLWKIMKQVRQSTKQDDFFHNAVKVVQHEFKADRVIIYRFDGDNTGKVIAEALVPGWTPGMNETLSCSSFGGQKAAEYQAQGFIAIENPHDAKVTPYQQQLWEKFQVQASLALPILLDSFSPQSNGYELNQVWGLLVVQQCEQPRQWQEDEINLLYQLTTELTRVMQSPLLSFKVEGQQDLVAAMEQSMEQSMKEKLHEIRHNLKADRALVYGFNPDGSGAIIAESVDSMWKKGSNSFDNDCFITPDNCQEKYVVEDIYNQNSAPCLLEQLESLEAKAYIIVPIKSGDPQGGQQPNRLLGMLGVYQNSAARNWKESEADLVVRSAPKFSFSLEQTSSIRDLRFKAKQAELISKQDFLTSISQNAEQTMQSWLDKIRASMKIDRAVVFAFNPDWSGKILAESRGGKWQPAGSVLDYDFHFKGGEYEPCYIANNVQSKGLARAVLEKFEQIEAKAYVVVPIHANNQLMGVLGVYQNSAPRNWQESEVKQLQEYAARFVMPLQQTAYLRNSEFQSKQMEQAFKREKGLSKILEKVRLSKDEQAVWQIATDEGRKILGVDRVSIYRFNPDWSGNFVADSVAPGWSDLTKVIPFIEDTFLQNTKGGRYKNGETFAVEDIYLQGHKQCHIELLEQMEARAYALAPIFIADSNMFGSKKLWGLIGCYQNEGARRWQDYEIETLRQLGLQLGVAMQQINYLTRLEKQSELEKTSSKISEQIRRSENIDEVFKVTTQEIRQALKTDRTVVYQFNPDWSGQVVAESVASGWVSLLVEQTNDEVLSGDRTKDNRCILRKWSTDDITETDTYLEKTRGGKYTSEGKKYTAVDDIYTQKFPDCYIKSLEKYQAKAYIIAPIFQGDKLWGLLGAYENSGSRSWLTLEAEQIAQLANQLGIAIQQIDYYEQLRIQSDSLSQTLERERAAKEELQKQAVEMLRTVRPAFSGDLTVRANVTETEIGTIAGAYNTTLDSLKGIVEQVQMAALQVTETTGASSSAIKGLSAQSEKQLLELQEALDRVQSMIDASMVTTENAQKVEVAIEQANKTVQAGDQAMNNTVDGIASIRETVADAGKRVKRLSDSSQKISKVVSLISSFATQTNLLALNAALEATRAGEYGKGFAVVADEVRNLSLQSTEATIEIEKLVREIQEETQQVSAAMEAGVLQVAEGTNLVNETRDSLNEIVAATAEIKDLVQGITSAANVQTQEAASVTQVMGQVAEIANETSQDSGKISLSFGELEQLAQKLQASVSQFKVK